MRKSGTQDVYGSLVSRNSVNVVCPRCQETVQTPDDPAQAICARCGQHLAPAETQVAAGAPTSAGLQAAPEEAWRPGRSDPGQQALPETYASWEEFRQLSPTLQSELIKLAVRALPDMRDVEVRALPIQLPPKVDEFGHPLATMTIAGEKRPLNAAVALLAGFIGVLCLLFGAYGLRAPLMMRDSILAISILMLIGMVGVGFAVWHTFLRQPMLEITFWIFENGLLVRRGGDIEACAWEDIKDFRSVENVGHPVYTIVTRSDCRLILSAAQSAAIMPLAEYLKVKIASAQLLPRLQRIFEGNPVKFGALWLDNTGIKGRVIAPWSEIDRIVGDDALLYIDCRGLDAWQQIPLHDIAFPLLLLAIAHVMIEDAKRMPADDA